MTNMPISKSRLIPKLNIVILIQLPWIIKSKKNQFDTNCEFDYQHKIY